MTGSRAIVIVVALLCASTAQAKTHAGVVKGVVRGPMGSFDGVQSYQLTYRLSQQHSMALAEYRFRYAHKRNARFLGVRFGVRNIPFREVRATVPSWVVVQARVRFFSALGKADGSAQIYLFADELKAAGAWSDPRGPKRAVPWAQLFHKVKTTRTLRDALPSDHDFAAKLNKELLLSSSRIIIDRPRVLHLHYGRRVWRAFARAHWRGHKQRLSKLSTKKFWNSDPVRTAPTAEPASPEHTRAASIYRVGIPVTGTSVPSPQNALVVQSPSNNSSSLAATTVISGMVQPLWRRLAKRVMLTLHGQTTYAALTSVGRFQARLNLRPGHNRIKVELDGPSHKISKTVTVIKRVRGRQALSWVCIQTFAEKYKPHNRRQTKSYVSRVFTTYYTTKAQRSHVQQQFQQFVINQYGTSSGWRPYSTSCTPYGPTQSRYVHTLFRSYSRYARPNSRDRRRYRRLPGAIVTFRYKEQ